MRNLDGQTAFVTGAASGIGLATAQALAAKGVRLVLADIDEARVIAAAASLNADGAEAIGIKLDVADEADWARARARAAAFGDVRILFSNAGVGAGSSKFEEYDTEVWRWAYAVNVHAHLYACRTFLGAMKASGEPAHIVVTASMVSIVPPPISVAYISSKYAALGIAMGLRNELADSAVGLSVLCPGVVATRLIETSQSLLPGARRQDTWGQTAQAKASVLASGMAPEAIGRRVVRAIENGEFYIFTHPEWRRLAELQSTEMLAAFGESADPAYAGDDIGALGAASGARRTNV